MSGRKDSANFMRRAVTVQQAVESVLESIRPLGREEVPLVASIGRFLAKEVTAAQPVPHFRRSGMDGFAVRAADVAEATIAEPARLWVVDDIPAGAVSGKRLGAGECARIMTGAAVPEGADAVIKYEMTEEDDKPHASEGELGVLVKGSVVVGENISAIGSEIAAGDMVLPAGTRIGQGEIALLAMFGVARVPVFTAPRVAVLTTGSELLAVDQQIQPGRIRNSNGYMIAAAVAEYGGLPSLLDPVPDDAGLAGVAILSALADFDAVVTTGGVSVGDHDILYDVTQEWDGDLKFNKVMMRPGSPTTFGLWKGKPLFALSGNPSACFVGCRLFVGPALRKMQGTNPEPKPRLTAQLAVDYPKSDRFTRFVRGIVSENGGKLSARPVGPDQSSVTVSLRDANCLIVLPGSPKGIEAGTLVEIILL
ncbi:gephyrin-like molybdotransferase Glp [Gorillibacterium massiliense]|uniref:molybdopterin molybdotransferase MoeA n=1 Tax=Gorillibacterium massiliense TaxID=1280390 RepID=UPI0004AE6487|nr:gephyrin-like molybdotransferase Glp [Gorillibacterium massiliense]